ncbi:hypothetical protein D3C78_1740110 [compost metagenome]
MAPVTRTASPWMLACTLSLPSLISATIFFASSVSMPSLTVTVWVALLPPTCFTSPYSRQRTSMPRLASLPSRMSMICWIWNSASPCRVITFSFSSRLALVPLKS